MRILKSYEHGALNHKSGQRTVKWKTKGGIMDRGL